jgi:hypothetical protein
MTTYDGKLRRDTTAMEEAQENGEERGRQVAAQNNAVVAMNTESTHRTEGRSDSNHARKSHERRVIQSER